MKKNYFLAACAAAFLTCGVFSACSEDDPIPDNGNENNGGGTTPTEEAFSRFVVATFGQYDKYPADLEVSDRGQYHIFGRGLDQRWRLLLGFLQRPVPLCFEL